MKRLLPLLSILCCLPGLSWGQGQSNRCNFGFTANTIINFNTPVPSVDTLPNAGDNQSHWAGTVCWPNGALRFFVRFQFNFTGLPQCYVFGPDGFPITGSDDLFTDAGMLDFSMPVIIPRPGNADQFYIFHSRDYGLFYSLLDMSLNGGAGGIVLSEKNIQIAAYGSIYTRLIAPVKGCNGAWLVIRSQIANEYYSYHITSTGIDTQKVVSPLGNFPQPDYNWGGFLKASPDGTMLATTNWAGVELYAFEQCSGRLKDARVIDTTGNPALFPGAAVTLPTHSYFTGLCFSPDNSKLYITRNKHLNFMVEPGELFQFNLGLLSIPAIIGSKTLIITNPPSLFENLSTMQCDLVGQNPLGEIKAGPDGKIYIDNGSYTCLDTANVPPGYNPGPAFHVLNAPNNTGLACLPILNHIKSPTSYWFYASSFGGISYLQNDIIYSSSAPDTVQGAILNKTACFTDTLSLKADTSGHCFLWDNGSIDRERLVYEAGTYFASYFRDCAFTTDTFKIKFTQLPQLKVVNESCDGLGTGRLAVYNADQDTSIFRAIWKDTAGNILRDNTTRIFDEIRGLTAGKYSVDIITDSGCDTTLSAVIQNLPHPNLAVSPSDTIIRYGDSIMLHVSGASFYTWSPSGPLDSSILANPIARPLQPTLFTVIGFDRNGCMDTGYINIHIDYTMKSMLPNAFSPNGDGLNDIFRIEGLTFQTLLQFDVFNRYGQRVFNSIDVNKGWDGTQNGAACEVGNYYYLIQLEIPDGTKKTFKGDVMLIR